MTPVHSCAASRHVSFFMLGSLLFLVSLAPAASGAGATADLGAIVARVRAESGIDFLDLAVTRSDGPCTRAAYSEPVPRMHAASISKLFTATVVMQLVREGRLRLQDPIGAHLPSFAGSGITIADLLAHRSGLRDTGGTADPDGRSSRAEVDRYITELAELAALAAQTRAQSPEERRPAWHYADANYNLLGHLLATVTGEPFAALMQARLLVRLGMLDSTFAVEEVSEPARVQGWSRSWGRLRPQSPSHDRAFAPSRGLQTTATDLARFAQAVLAASEGLEDDVIAPVTILQMTERRAATDEPGVDAGFGWRIADTELGVQWRHGGAEAGLESLLTVYPERGFAIVVMGNRSGWPRFELEEELRERVAVTDVCTRWQFGGIE